MGRNARPLSHSLPFASNEAKGLEIKADLRQKSRLDGELSRGINPNSRKSKSGVGRKKGRLLQREVVLCDSKEVGADLELDDGELGGESVGVAAAVASAQRNVPQSGELPPDHAQRPGACFPIIF